METLKRQKDFERAYKAGKKIYEEKFRMIYLNAEEAQQSKVAFVVSKKYGRTAVRRNRIKRLLREAWRMIQAPAKGYIFILLPQTSTFESKPCEIAENMKNALEKEKLLIDT